MTVLVNALVSDGIIMASDTRQIFISSSGEKRINTDRAQKVFQLSQKMAVSVLNQSVFYSDLAKTPFSIRSLINQIAEKIDTKTTIEIAASVLHEELNRCIQKHEMATNKKSKGVSFYVGGYSPNSSIGELYACEVPGDVKLQRTTEDAGLVWGGQRDYIDRIILGLDHRIYDLPIESPDVIDTLRKFRKQLQLRLNFQIMELHDAIDLVELLVGMTNLLSRLSDGLVAFPGSWALCGGEIDTAIITPIDGFRWIRNNHRMSNTTQYT